MPIRDPDRSVLLSDVHVSRNPAKVERGANPMQPTGWTDCHLSADSATLTLHALDPRHPRHLHRWTLPYRR